MPVLHTRFRTDIETDVSAVDIEHSSVVQIYQSFAVAYDDNYVFIFFSIICLAVDITYFYVFDRL